MQQENDATGVQMLHHGGGFVRHYPCTKVWRSLGVLATNQTWFKNVWQYADHLAVTVCINKSNHIQPVWLHNQALMEMFYAMGFWWNSIQELNQVQKYKHLIHLSDIVLCDWAYLYRKVIWDACDDNISHSFPREASTRGNFAQWDKTILGLFTLDGRLERSLVPALDSVWGWQVVVL